MDSIGFEGFSVLGFVLLGVKAQGVVSYFTESRQNPTGGC